MRIVVFGGSGRLGQRVVREALDRGHDITTVVHGTASLEGHAEHMRALQGDATDPDSVATVSAGHDAAINAVGPSGGQRPEMLVAAARALLSGLSRARVHCLIIAGGAGSLEVAPGLRLLDSPQFHAAWRPGALAHAAALEVYRNAATDVDWSYASPANILVPGERTGGYREGGEQLLTDAEGNSFISMEDFAIALLDEVEHPKHTRTRFSVAH